MAEKIEMPKVTKNKKASKAHKLVYQGNPLIQSRKYFNAIGMRLFILGLMTINPHLSKKDKFFDEEFPLVHISPSELAKLFGDSKYLGLLKAECEKLFDSHITLDYKDGGWKLMHIFDIMEYKANDGLYIQFDPKMKDYLLDLVKGGYTTMNIEQMFKLTSTYAVRLIEICMQYRNMTKGNVITRKLNIKDLKFCLNIPDDAYKGRMDNFKRYVLDEPIKEIEAKTDFRLSYRTEKEGRKVKYFVFELDISLVKPETFDLKVDYDKKLPVPAPYADVLSELVLQGFSHKSAKEIIEAVNDNVECGLRLEYALKIMPEYHKKNPIQNRQGFLRKAILEDWRKNDVKSKNKMNISDASKIKNNMQLNNLDAEKDKIQQQVNDANHAIEKTGISQADLQGDEMPIAASMVKVIAQDILKNTMSETTKGVLRAFNFTPERFQQVYMANGMAENIVAFKGNSGGFSNLSNVISAFG